MPASATGYAAGKYTAASGVVYITADNLNLTKNPKDPAGVLYHYLCRTFRIYENLLCVSEKRGGHISVTLPARFRISF